MTTLKERSKYLSYLLRHAPEKAGLTLDKEGWCSTTQLVRNTDFTLMELDEIVRLDEKQRYSFDDELKSNIRANQGHSTEKVKITFKRAVPPTVLYHGTSDEAAAKIWAEGLKPMSRHHVHLSADLETAQAVGGRRKRDLAIFYVDAKWMLADGHQFYISDNGVWLVDAVPPKYLRLVK